MTILVPFRRDREHIATIPPKESHAICINTCSVQTLSKAEGRKGGSGEKVLKIQGNWP